MRLIIDYREQDLYNKCEAVTCSHLTYNILKQENLSIGDALIQSDEGRDLVIIERKTLTDLLASLKDGRYKEQSHRLKRASGLPCHNVFYIIEGMYSTLKTSLEKKLILSAMTSLSFFKGFSVMRTCSIQETAELLVFMSDKIDRGLMDKMLPAFGRSHYFETQGQPTPHQHVSEPLPQVNQTTEETKEEKETQEPQEYQYSQFVKKVKKENITETNIGEIMLCQIPGISSTYALAILQHFNGFSNLMTEIKNNSTNFDNISYMNNGKSRKIPKTCKEQLFKYLGKL